ncbi:MAG TPA: hypothetical protein VNJ03_07800 [Vicinamibacterales bacterium]|nr:hypothetical protein [Vicinamibacterales bacterium]
MRTLSTAYGRRVSSFTPLPELPPWATAPPTDASNWTVALASIIEPASGVAWSVLWRFPGGEVWAETGRNDNAVYFRFPRRADFRVSGGVITAAVLAYLTLPTLRHILLDTVLPLALAAEGRLVLHASAMRTPESATIVLCGGSGAGKSTLTAALGRRGFRILSDDGVLIEAGTPVQVVASYPGLRLWPDAADALGYMAGPTIPVADQSDKVRVAVESFTDAGTGVPTAIYMLQTAVSGFRIERLAPRDATAGIIRHAFRADLHDRAALERQLHDAAALAEAVPVWEVGIPRSFARLGEFAERLAAHAGATHGRAVPC